MAIKDADSPPPEARKWRRLMPSFLAAVSANSLIRASTLFWVLLCGGGMYSPFETTRVGIGDGQSASSASYARVHLASCSSLSSVWSGSQVPPVSFHWMDIGSPLLRSSSPRARRCKSARMARYAVEPFEVKG